MIITLFGEKTNCINSLPVLHKHFVLFAFFILFSACQSTQGQEKGTNRLAQESSPYLLQHARNPVNWYPWKAEALKDAKADNKLMVVSIGYAACHWCHVMEEESFTDEEVANVMNGAFISIKVDREERPDIDEVYMGACQLTSQSCGWPLNAITLPDGRPIWTGTYLPKAEWLKVLRFFDESWPKEKAKMEAFADQLQEGMASLYPDLQPEEEPNQDLVPKVRNQLLRQLDARRGGLKGSPKFPLPSLSSFLLHEYYLSGSQEALQAVETQLNRMARGGIYDQIGGGFARYSTDDQWLIPHFEKMLYDNAQLASLYIKAYQATNNAFYKEIAIASLNWVLTDLADPKGGFYSSLDADSEGEEGLFYTWTDEQWQAAVPDAPKWVKTYYGFQGKGNLESGRTILHRPLDLEELVQQEGLAEETAKAILIETKNQLLKARSQRIPPATDDKIITAWNGLLVASFCDAYRAFQVEEWKKQALQTGTFLWKNLWIPEKGLFRIYKNGNASTPAFLTDYAQLISAWIDLYEITFDPLWIERANILMQRVEEEFSQAGSPLFYYTSDQSEALVVRTQDIWDNVIPASNSVLARALHRLGLLLGKESYSARAQRMLSATMTSWQDGQPPSRYANWGSFLLETAFPFYEVAIVGDTHADKRKALQKRYLPQTLFLGGPDEGDLPLLENKRVEGQTMIYVCLDKLCKMPVEEPTLAFSQINNN